MRNQARLTRRVLKKFLIHKAIVFRKKSTRIGTQWVESFVKEVEIPARFSVRYAEGFRTNDAVIDFGKEASTQLSKLFTLDGNIKSGDRLVPIFKGIISDSILFEVEGVPRDPSYIGHHFESSIRKMEQTFTIDTVNGNLVLNTKG